MLTRLVSLGILLASSASAQGNPERDAYYGETHVHTGWSFDAFIFGNTKTSPVEAYQYGKGEPIEHPMGYDIKIDTPLDWMGVTDHSEYVGVVQLANEPNSVLGKTPLGQKLIVHGPEDIQRIYLLLGGSMIDGKPYRELTTVYKLGDKHYAARSNEFGYANYELIPVPAQLGTEVQFNPPK